MDELSKMRRVIGGPARRWRHRRCSTPIDHGRTGREAPPVHRRRRSYRCRVDETGRLGEGRHRCRDRVRARIGREVVGVGEGIDYSAAVVLLMISRVRSSLNDGRARTCLRVRSRRARPDLHGRLRGLLRAEVLRRRRLAVSFLARSPRGSTGSRRIGERRSPSAGGRSPAPTTCRCDADAADPGRGRRAPASEGSARPDRRPRARPRERARSMSQASTMKRERRPVDVHRHEVAP